MPFLLICLLPRPASAPPCVLRLPKLLAYNPLHAHLPPLTPFALFPNTVSPTPHCSCFTLTAPPAPGLFLLPAFAASCDPRQPQVVCSYLTPHAPFPVSVWLTRPSFVLLFDSRSCSLSAAAACFCRSLISQTSPRSLHRTSNHSSFTDRHTLHRSASAREGQPGQKAL